MKKDLKTKNENNFTLLKDIQITKFQDKQIEPSTLTVPDEFFDKSVFLQTNEDENYIQDNFHFWSEEIETQIYSNKNKDFFKEENYDYIQLTKNKNVMWKRPHNFFKYLKKQKKNKKETGLKDFTFLQNHKKLLYKKKNFSKCDMELTYNNKLNYEEESVILKICETLSRNATEIEIEEIKKKEEKKKVQKKKEDQIYEILDPILNDLKFTNNENKIIKWIASVLQNIIEQDIKDVYVK